MKNIVTAVIFTACVSVTMSSAMAASVPACDVDSIQNQCTQHREIARLSDDVGLFDTLMGGGVGKCRLTLIWAEHSGFFGLDMAGRKTVTRRIDIVSLSPDSNADRDAQVPISAEGKYVLDIARRYLQTCSCIR